MNKKKPAPVTLKDYSKTMDKAVKSLDTAIIYAEDGAQLDAIRCAVQAIGLLFEAKAQKNHYLAAQQKEILA